MLFYNVNLLSQVQGVLHNNLDPWPVKGASFSEYFMIYPWRGALQASHSQLPNDH